MRLGVLPSNRSPALTKSQKREHVSLRTSLISALRLALLASRSTSSGTFDNADRAIRIDEDLVGDAANIRFADLVNAIHRPKQLTPIVISGLESSELHCQALIVGESTNQVRLGSCLDHLQLVVRDVFLLQSFNLLVNRIRHF